jgi:transketolase N-terminal domain/subunit
MSKNCNELELAVLYYESVIRKEDAEKQKQRFTSYKDYVDNLILAKEHYNKNLYKSLTDLRKYSEKHIEKFIKKDKHN